MTNLNQRKKSTLLRLFVFVCFWFLTWPAQAVVFEVTTAEEFQAALGLASSNGGEDEILLAPGTYVGNFKFTLKEAFAIRIASKDPSQPAVIDAGGKNFGLWLVGYGYQADFDIEGLVVQNANTVSVGGGVLARDVNGALTISNVVFQNNTAKGGSGLHTENVDRISVLSSKFMFNEVLDSGRGTIDLGGRNGLLIENSIFEGNVGSIIRVGQSAKYGSGGYPSSIIRANQFRQVGPGHVLSYLGRNSDYVTFENNKVVVQSGSLVSASSLDGFHARDNTFETANCGLLQLGMVGNSRYMSSWVEIHSNLFRRQATLDCSGGQWVNLTRHGSDGSGPLAVRLSSNVFQDGEVRITWDGIPIALTLVNNTFVGSTRSIYTAMHASSSITVSNNVFGPGITEPFIHINQPLEAILTNNVISNVSGYWDVQRSNLAIDPGFYDPENGDYRLAPDSAAIDAGTNEAITDPDATDLDGNPRIINGTVDIGAYERNTAPLHPADTNEDSIITLDEFNAYNTAWRANDTWPTPPNEIPIDYVTRAGYLLQKGGEYKNIGVGKPLTWVPVSQ